jgi:4-amino-4-deoxy-L-arabinose transferase-like glycosyltransferase
MKIAAFDQNLRRASWRYNTRTIVLPILLTALGVTALFLLFVAGPQIARIRDIQAAPLQQSVARVTNVVLQPGRMQKRRSLLTLRLPGFSAPVTVFHPDPTLHEGDRVSIAYRVGKSGRVYVEHLERLPAADRKDEGYLPR